MNRVLGSLIVLFVAAGAGLADDPYQDAKEKRAAANIRNLTLAANTYHAKYQVWPEKLTDLTKPKGGDPPFVKADANDLKDPWGQDFKYAVAKNEKGEERAYVWAERVIGDKPPGKAEKR